MVCKRRSCCRCMESGVSYGKPSWKSMSVLTDLESIGIGYYPA